MSPPHRPKPPSVSEQYVRILSTQPKHRHPVWMSRCRILPAWLERTNKEGVLSSLYWGWRLFRASRSFDVVLTGSERAAHVFALLQLIFGRRRVPHILIECMWTLPPNGVRRIFRTLQWRLEARSMERIVVWSRTQLMRYPEALGISPAKWVFVPYHVALGRTDLELAREDYIFAGGDSGRDYRTLVEAARGIRWRVVIAARKRTAVQKLPLPSNVMLVSPSHDEFLRLMARAGIVVVPLLGGRLHSGGHQTYLNAMQMAKPVVVADDCGADEYISDGIDGVVVRPGDPQAMRQALIRLIEDPPLARRLGANAARTAQQYSLERYCEKMFRLAEEVAKPERC